MLAARFNRPGHEIVDHHTSSIASDGDMQEGVASEACSLAGHLGLGRLIALLRRQPHLDRGRHRALASPRTSAEALRGLRLARPEPRRGHRARPARGRRWPTRRAVADRPRLIVVRTHIAPGSPNKQDTARRARRAARRRGDQAHQGGLRLALARSRSSSPTRRSSTSASASRAARSAEAEWRERFERLPHGPPGRGGRVRAHPAPRAARRLGRRRAQEGPRRGHDRHAQGVPGRHPVGGRRRCPSWSAARPTSRPRRSR